MRTVAGLPRAVDDWRIFIGGLQVGGVGGKGIFVEAKGGGGLGVVYMELSQVLSDIVLICW